MKIFPFAYLAKFALALVLISGQGMLRAQQGDAYALRYAQYIYNNEVERPSSLSDLGQSSHDVPVDKQALGVQHYVLLPGVLYSYKLNQQRNTPHGSDTLFVKLFFTKSQELFQKQSRDKALAPVLPFEKTDCVGPSELVFAGLDTMEGREVAHYQIKGSGVYYTIDFWMLDWQRHAEVPAPLFDNTACFGQAKCDSKISYQVECALRELEGLPYRIDVPVEMRMACNELGASMGGLAISGTRSTFILQEIEGLALSAAQSMVPPRP